MGTISLTLPTAGSTLNSLADPEIVTAFTTVQTAINGNIDGVNAPTLETAFSTYKTVLERIGMSNANVANTYILQMVGTVVGLIPASNSVAGTGVFYFDPADWTANTRTTKLRVRASVVTNATAPTITYTLGLYPVTASAGAGGNVTITLGTVVAGSTAAIATPGASSQSQVSSGDFTAPAAGFYVLAVLLSGNEAANAASALRAQLQMRQV